MSDAPPTSSHDALELAIHERAIDLYGEGLVTGWVLTIERQLPDGGREGRVILSPRTSILSLKGLGELTNISLAQLWMASMVGNGDA